jgi:hypothetical protein
MKAGDLSIFKSEKGFTLREWYLRTPHGYTAQKLMSKYAGFLGTELDKVVAKAKVKGVIDFSLWRFRTERDGEIASWAEPEVYANLDLENMKVIE